jgi:RNA polymerase subunit RPABC4/transcription elongation factor Spt4
MPPRFKNEIDESTIKKVVDMTMDKVEKTDEKKMEAKEKIDRIKEYMEKKSNCPSCHSHKLKVDTDRSTAKCVGDECHKEYLIIDKNSKHACSSCGIPHSEGAEKCPFCNSTDGKLLDKSWADEILEAQNNK